MPSPTQTLVTGGAGFIGSHLVRRLLERGDSIRVVDNLSTGSIDNLGDVMSDIEFVRGDLRDPAVCERVVSGADVVFHIAALPSVPRSLADPLETHASNVTATMNLLVACRANSVRRVVYSSSSSVYGDTAVLPKVEDVEPLPRSPYAVSKLAGEQYVLAFARGGILEGAALRYFNVFGPRQDPYGPYAAVVPLFMIAARDGTPATIYGDGNQTRDFTFVDNVVDANLLAADGPAASVNGHAVNVGAGVRTSLRELLDLVRSISGREVHVHHLEPRAGDVRDSLAGLSRARQVLGYDPRVGVREGLERTWQWMTESGRNPGETSRRTARAARA